MRAIALLAAVAVGALAFEASAEQWNDPSGRLTFDAPAGWVTSVEQSEAYTYVVTGTASNECHVISRPNPGTAAATPEAVHRAAANDAQFGPDQWTRVANGFSNLFPNNSAQVESRSSESPNFWTIQRAEIRSPERLVHGAMQLRPGFDLITLCMTYDGADATGVYDNIIRSVAHPNDAALRAEAERVAAEHAARAAENEGQRTQTEEERRREERRRRVSH